MSRKILVTAIKWNEQYLSAVKKYLAAANKKYKGNLLIIVGYTAIGVKIAALASEAGLSVQMFAPDLDIQPKAIDVVNGITVTSTTKPEYMRQMIQASDAVMALDKGDPVVMTATKLNKQIWFPFDG